MNLNHYSPKYVSDLILKVAAAVGLPAPTIKIESDNPYAAEATPDLAAVPDWQIRVNGLMISPMIVGKEYKSILGTRTILHNGFIVERGITIPGCHTMPNGDPGYPDDFDFETVKECIHVSEAVEIVVLHNIKEQVNEYLQGHFEAEDFGPDQESM